MKGKTDYDAVLFSISNQQLKLFVVQTLNG
jgi:hypothetical protein